MFINKIKNMEGVFFAPKNKMKESFHAFTKSNKRDVGYLEL